MTALLDSSAWLEYFFGSQAGAHARQVVEDSMEAVVLTKVNVFEIYHKVAKERGRDAAERFTHFALGRCVLDELEVDTIKLACAQKRDHGLGMAEAIVLATAVKHGARLYTTDSDFQRTSHVVETVFL